MPQKPDFRCYATATEINPVKTKLDLEYVKVMRRQRKITESACVAKKWKLFDIC